MNKRNQKCFITNSLLIFVMFVSQFLCTILVLFALEIKVQVLIFVLSGTNHSSLSKKFHLYFWRISFCFHWNYVLKVCLKLVIFIFYFFYFDAFSKIKIHVYFIYILVGHDCGERWKCLECFCDYILIDRVYIFPLKHKTTWDLSPYHHNKCVSLCFC